MPPLEKTILISDLLPSKAESSGIFDDPLQNLFSLVFNFVLGIQLYLESIYLMIRKYVLDQFSLKRSWFGLPIILQVVNVVVMLPLIGNWFNFVLSISTSIIRLGAGNWAADGLETCVRPKELMKLYDWEGGCECRSVRETLSVLGLDVMIHPVPNHISKRNRIALEQFMAQDGVEYSRNMQPVLIDPNESSVDHPHKPIVLHGALSINNYLWDKYGNTASPPLNYRMVQLLEADQSVIGHFYRALPSYFRPLDHMGNVAIPSTYRGIDTKQLMELYSFESCPYSRLVRECMCSMQIPYIVRNIPKGYYSKRREFMMKYGSQVNVIRKLLNLVVVPLLVEHKDDVGHLPAGMKESSVIMEYLHLSYDDVGATSAPASAPPAGTPSKSTSTTTSHTTAGSSSSSQSQPAGTGKKKKQLYTPLYAGEHGDGNRTDDI